MAAKAAIILFQSTGKGKNMELNDFFEAVAAGDYSAYDSQITTLAEEVAIITQDESDLVVAARELKAATEKFDDLYCSAHYKWLNKA